MHTCNTTFQQLTFCLHHNKGSHWLVIIMALIMVNLQYYLHYKYYSIYKLKYYIQVKHHWKRWKTRTVKNKNGEKQHNIMWSIICKANAYNNRSKRCNLCLTEKLCIVKSKNNNLLNKRDELISKCRHENKFYIMNYKNEVT